MKRHPIFARVYDVLGRAAQPWMRAHREEVAGGAFGRILEIGVGTGLNFEHYRGGRLVVGVEPEPSMARRAAGAAADSPVRVAVVRGVAEALPFRDGAFDSAVGTLVLCSVQDVGRAAAEMRRVLAPGATLRFFEHVRASGQLSARCQDAIAGAWAALAGGCHPNRDPIRALREVGFTVRFRSFGAGLPPVRPHVLGAATAP